MNILTKFKNKVVLLSFLSLVLLITGASSQSFAQYSGSSFSNNLENSSQIIVNNQILQYSITGGTILSVSYNTVLPSLDITVDSNTGGQVTLDIPRNLVDSKDNFLSDAPFIITNNGNEVKPEGEQDHTYFRILILGFDNDTSHIEVIGNGHANLPKELDTIKITDPFPHARDLFGTSIAATKDKIIIGAPNAYSDNLTRGGMVYLYDTKGNQVLSIPDPDNKDGDQFGYAVASIGGNILVGAPNAQVSGAQTGKVYLFDTQGRLLQTIPDPSPNDGDQFGFAITELDNQIIVGSPLHVDNQIRSGSVFVFDDTTGKELVSIHDPDAKDGDLFGFALTPILNVMAVGAPNSSFNAPQAGSVFLFDIKTDTLKQILRNPEPDNRTEPNQGWDQFGFALASIDKYLVVGERGGDIKQLVNGHEQYMVDQSGNVRIYDTSNGNLTLTIDDPTPVQNNDFGVAVATQGNKILVGMNHDDTLGYDSGSAYLYNISGQMLRTIQNPEPTSTGNATMGNYFGSSTAFLNDYLIIGSPGDNTGATNAGAVYAIQDNSTIQISPSPHIVINSNQYFPPLPSMGTPVYPLPLEQFRTGAAANDVKCNTDLVLILKLEDGTPACVKPDDAYILIYRSWAKEFIQYTANNSSLCEGTQVSSGEIGQNIFPVLIMSPNSTATVCVTYKFNSDWQTYPNKDVYPHGILETCCIIHMESHSSPGSSNKFEIFANPPLFNVTNIHNGSKLSVIYKIYAKPDSGGFYDTSVPFDGCLSYPLAVGYDQSQIDATKFHADFDIPCFNTIENVDSVNIISGMTYKSVQFP